MKAARSNFCDAVAAVVLTLGFAAAAPAVDIEWDAGTGDYLTGANWAGGNVPGANDTAFINNGGTPQYATDTISDLDGLRVGENTGATGNLEVSAGELDVDFGSVFIGGRNATGVGVLNVTGGALRSADDFQLGRIGTGTLNLSGGLVESGFAVVGKFGSGIWNQSGGVFRQPSFGDLEIGDGGRPDETEAGPRTGTIDLSGGVVQTRGAFAIGNRTGNGEVNISGGGLAITGNFSSSLIIGRGMDASPGQGGDSTLRVIGADATIAVARDLLINPANAANSATLVAQITGPTHTPILASRNANITNGDFKVELDGYSPVLGDSWTIIEAGADIFDAVEAIDDLVDAEDVGITLNQQLGNASGSVIGQFANEDLSVSPGPGLQFELTYSQTTVTLSVVSAPLFGDYNDDGRVDVADYTEWRDNLGTMASLSNDSTPGEVSIEDYNVWRQNFGAVAPGEARAFGSAVPEPAAVWVVALAVLGWGRRRATGR